MFSQASFTLREQLSLSFVFRYFSSLLTSKPLKTFMKVLKVIRMILDSEGKETYNDPCGSNHNLIILFSSPNEESPLYRRPFSHSTVSDPCHLEYLT